MVAWIPLFSFVSGMDFDMSSREKKHKTLYHVFSMFHWMVPGMKAMRRALSWASLGCRCHRCHRCHTYRCRRCRESPVSCQVLRPRGRWSSVFVGDKVVARGWGDFGPTWPNFQKLGPKSICYCHCHWRFNVSHTLLKAICLSLKERHPCRQVYMLICFELL